MSTTELSVIVGPLVALVAVLSVVEVRTKLIPNAIVFPAAIYFVTAGPIVGAAPWWHYIVGLVTTLAMLMLVGHFLALPGGTIKLGAVIGGALGVMVSWQYVAFFAVSLLVVLLTARGLTQARQVPSTPIQLIALIALLCFRLFVWGD